MSSGWILFLKLFAFVGWCGWAAFGYQHFDYHLDDAKFFGLVLVIAVALSAFLFGYLPN